MKLLSTLASWTRVALADGVVLGEPGGCTIVMRQRVRPIPGLRALLDAALESPTTGGRMKRFTTLEGEHAAMAWLDSGDRQAAVAVVVGDESAATVIARGPVAAPGGSPEVALPDVVQQLAEHTFLGLGEIRRRRYCYRPPEGWRGLERPHAARWLHPGFPRIPHTLTVFDARPHLGTGPEIADRLLFTDRTHGQAKDGPQKLVPVQVESGLTGSIARIGFTRQGEHIAVVRATLRDERFAYALELTGPSASIASDLPTFTTVLDSVAAIPERRMPDHSDRVLIWGD